MRILHDLDPDLHDKIVAQGCPVDNTGSRGTNACTLDVQSTSEKATIAEDEFKEVCITIPLHGLWRTLRQHIVEKYGETAIEYRTVVGLDREVESNSMRWRVHSRNGEGKRDVDEATLVIGADGVNGVNGVLRKTLLTKSLFFDEGKHNPIHSAIYRTWILPKLPLWGEQGLVLIGSAAYALNPTLGQDVSQALEDVQTATLLLTELPDDEKYGSASWKYRIDEATRIFCNVRSPRIDSVVKHGKKLAWQQGIVGFVSACSTYYFSWLLSNFSLFDKVVVSDLNQELYHWSARDEIRKALENEPHWQSMNENE